MSDDGVFPLENFLEPRRELRFASEGRLREHTEKHVLKAREERWHRILGAERLSRARDEWRRGQWGPDCRKIASDYQELLSMYVLRACEDGQHHQHFAKYHVADGLTRGALDTLEITCWDVGNRLVLFAACNVLNSETTTPYRLRTGYRVHQRMGQEAFVRKARESTRAMRNSLCFVLVADHSNGSAVETGSSEA